MRFKLWQTVIEVESCWVEADSKEAALKLWDGNSEIDSGDWQCQETLGTDLFLVGEQGEDGKMVKEYRVFDGKFTD